GPGAARRGRRRRGADDRGSRPCDLAGAGQGTPGTDPPPRSAAGATPRVLLGRRLPAVRVRAGHGPARVRASPIYRAAPRGRGQARSRAARLPRAALRRRVQRPRAWPGLDAPGRPRGSPHPGDGMSDDITHRLTVEGVDPLCLAGVNDGNLIELTKRLGVRVSLRGDALTLQGPLAAVERATPVAEAMVD